MYSLLSESLFDRRIKSIKAPNTVNWTASDEDEYQAQIHDPANLQAAESPISVASSSEDVRSTWSAEKRQKYDETMKKAIEDNQKKGHNEKKDRKSREPRKPREPRQREYDDEGKRLKKPQNLGPEWLGLKRKP